MTSTLARIAARTVSRRDGAPQRCGVCAAPIAPEHRHLLDEADSVTCACPACLVLFDRGVSGGYLVVPDRRVRLRPASTDGLNVPVGLAFVVDQGDGRVVAHYPSPLGGTWAEVDPEAWTGVEAGSPALAGMRPAVEALLVRVGRAGGGIEHWIVPVDECYRLVAVIRKHWTGMAGGAPVWREVARFFSELR